MTYADFRAQLEADLEWRETEIRSMQNELASLPETLRSQKRRPLILILYAHYEGFCKFAFSLYVNAINDEHLVVSDVSYTLAATALNDILNALTDSQHKSDFFRASLPDDAKLHRLARYREFLSKIELALMRPVSIPDKVIDMESNLKPAILRKTLFQVGLRHDQFSLIEGEINALLIARNNIAHGSRQGVGDSTYSRLRICIFKIFSEVLNQVSLALRLRQFERRRALQLPASTELPAL